MSGMLTAEQLIRIEASKQAALERKRKREEEDEVRASQASQASQGGAKHDITYDDIRRPLQENGILDPGMVQGSNSTPEDQGFKLAPRSAADEQQLVRKDEDGFKGEENVPPVDVVGAFQGDIRDLMKSKVETKQTTKADADPPPLSAEQQSVLEQAATGKSIFITGCGGTGRPALQS